MISNRRHIQAALTAMVHTGNVRIQEATMQRRRIDLTATTARMDAIEALVAPLIDAARAGTATVDELATGRALKAEYQALLARLHELAA